MLDKAKVLIFISKDKAFKIYNSSKDELQPL